MSNEEKLELAKELEQYTKEEMIEKYIDELEENCTLSDLWCKSQEELKELKAREKEHQRLNGELREENERLNNIIDKKEQLLGDNIKRLEREVVKRDNIINELEKYINEEYIYDELGMKIFDASKLQDKLQELKESDK